MTKGMRKESVALYVANKTKAIKQGECVETNFRYHTKSSHGLIPMGLRCKRHAEHTKDSRRQRHHSRKVSTCVRSREIVCGACFNDIKRIDKHITNTKHILKQMKNM